MQEVHHILYRRIYSTEMFDILHISHEASSFHHILDRLKKQYFTHFSRGFLCPLPPHLICPHPLHPLVPAVTTCNHFKYIFTFLKSEMEYKDNKDIQEYGYATLRHIDNCCTCYIFVVLRELCVVSTVLMMRQCFKATVQRILM